MTTKDQAIAKVESLKHLTKWLDSLGSEIHTYSLRGIALHGFEKGFDAAQPPAPDCRTCEHMNFCYAYTPYAACTNGDQYQPAPALVLWRTE